MSGSEGRTFKPIHRVAGAVVLVALAVVFLPMIFRPRTHTTTAPLPTSSPPPAPAAPVVAAPAVPAGAAASGAVTATAPGGPAPSVPALSQAKPQHRMAQAVVARPQPRRIVPVARRPARSGWFVQIAAFSNERAAHVLAERFIARGFPAQVDRQRAHRRSYFRVRIGPYRSRPLALRAQHRSRIVWPRGRTLLVNSRR
ncbi:MAG: SPOR domain-containing protein [Acidiferrobacteraceae bacterium]